MEQQHEPAGENWVIPHIRRSFDGQESCPPDTETGLRRLREIRGKRHRRRQHAGIAASGLAILLAAIAWIPQTRVYAARCVDACVAGVLATVQPLPIRPHAQVPDFALRDAEGNLVRLSDYRGKVVLLNFWATWCAPCRTEIPWFVSFQHDYQARGFTMVGLALDEGGWATVRPFLQREGVNYPNLVADEAVADRFGGLTALPMTLLIDRKGQLSATYTGLVSRADYERALLAALAATE